MARSSARARGRCRCWLKKQLYWHGLPEAWHLLPYEEFLVERRKLIASVTRDAFEQLGRDGRDQFPLPQVSPQEGVVEEASLASLIENGYLLPGDQLDPVDPDWVVDAVVTEDRTIQIDGIHEFDSLDDAARFLEVTNVSGSSSGLLNGRAALFL